MGKLSDSKLAKLKELLESDDPETKNESTDDEEFIVFRGSVDKFKEMFGFTPSSGGDSDDEGETETKETDPKPKPDPKPKGKGYFG